MAKKFENTVHVGDLAIAVATLGKLADPTAIGTAKTNIGALRTGLKLFTGLNPVQEDNLRYPIRTV